jgi:hypothetical protein
MVKTIWDRAKEQGIVSPIKEEGALNEDRSVSHHRPIMQGLTYAQQREIRIRIALDLPPYIMNPCLYEER